MSNSKDVIGSGKVVREIIKCTVIEIKIMAYTGTGTILVLINIMP